ncbi:MAG: DUF2855 family protein [Steroidobacteraceae bacterium]
MLEFQVRKDNFAETRIVETAALPLGDGQARLRLDLFAMTSNNITYAAMGAGELGYWDFFPAKRGWGRPPCWGFATVEASNSEHVAVGARVYGYFPIGTHLDVAPSRATPNGFFDAAEHRKPKSPVYNQYLLTSADPAYDSGREAEQSLFRPLYATGWWAADFINRAASLPGTVLLTSASAKTALATAHQLKSLGGARLIGLTSARNLEYVHGTGLYDQSVSYDNAGDIILEGTVVYVDFLGREEVTARLHRALGPALRRSVMIGATDWAAKPGGILVPKAKLDGPQPEFFFVPGYAAQRIKEEGVGLRAKMTADLRAFYAISHAFVAPTRLSGPAAVENSWHLLLKDQVSPSEGLVLNS